VTRLEELATVVNLQWHESVAVERTCKTLKTDKVADYMSARVGRANRCRFVNNCHVRASLPRVQRGLPHRYVRNLGHLLQPNNAFCQA